MEERKQVVRSASFLVATTPGLSGLRSNRSKAGGPTLRFFWANVLNPYES